jgi:type I restriction enzyme, R subunit
MSESFPGGSAGWVFATGSNSTPLCKSVTTDWAVRESARGKIRVMVRRILRKHGYPPDLQEEATRTVLEQAELLSADWAA